MLVNIKEIMTQLRHVHCATDIPQKVSQLVFIYVIKTINNCTMSKSEYLIRPEETKFEGSGKLRLRQLSKPRKEANNVSFIMESF